jgi:hypothetical protein
MTVTAAGAPGDTVQEEMLSDLTAVGAIYPALSKREGEEARRLWRVEPELRLLDEIGWSPVMHAPGRRPLPQLADEQAGERS